MSRKVQRRFRQPLAGYGRGVTVVCLASAACTVQVNQVVAARSDPFLAHGEPVRGTVPPQVTAVQDRTGAGE
jgi:hypothetical protein